MKADNISAFNSMPLKSFLPPIHIQATKTEAFVRLSPEKICFLSLCPMQNFGSLISKGTVNRGDFRFEGENSSFLMRFLLFIYRKGQLEVCVFGPKLLFMFVSSITCRESQPPAFEAKEDTGYALLLTAHFLEGMARHSASCALLLEPLLFCRVFCSFDC